MGLARGEGEGRVGMQVGLTRFCGVQVMVGVRVRMMGGSYSRSNNNSNSIGRIISDNNIISCNNSQSYLGVVIRGVNC